MVDDDLTDRLDDLEERLGVGDSGTTYVLPGTTCTDGVDLSPFTVETEIETPTDVEATQERVILPKHKPRWARGGVQCLEADDVRTLWESLPDDVRERELEARLEAGDPIPPFLQQ